MGLVGGYIIRNGAESFTWIYEHWIGLLTASVVFSTAQALVLYILSFRGEKLLALGGNSESHIYNVRSLNSYLYISHSFLTRTMLISLRSVLDGT